MKMRAEDREYVRRVLTGDREAFENLVRKYFRLGETIAFGIVGDFQLAEDVVQESFIKTFRSIEGLKDPGKFRVWFSGIVRKGAIDMLRHRKSSMLKTASLDASNHESEDSGNRLPAGSSLGESISEDARRADAESEEAVDRLVREEGRGKLLACISTLSEEDRTVIVMKHMEGLSYREIAEVTFSTVSAVESRLFRARQLLKRKLSPLLKTDGGDA